MKIDNTQVAFPQPSIEKLVNNQKQEFPKPSVPVENKDYSAIQNEASAKIESKSKNLEQDNIEKKQDYKPSLSDGQTTALKLNSVKSQIEAYSKGDLNNDEINIEVNINKIYENISELKTLQDVQTKKNGIESYQKTLIG